MYSRNNMNFTARAISNGTPSVSRSGHIRRTISARDNSGYHEPTLPTIQMVEAAIKAAKEYPSKYKLWRSLPKSMQYQTLEKVLNYLEASNKIMIDKDGAIIWIFADNPKLEKLLEGSIKLL
jgi:hypothetical protein